MKGLHGEKAIRNFDEDSLTMAVAAADLRRDIVTAEQTFGDGAAAFPLGCEDTIANIEDIYSHSDGFMNIWRNPFSRKL